MKTVYKTEAQALHLARLLNLDELKDVPSERWVYRVESFGQGFIVTCYDENGDFVNYL